MKECSRCRELKDESGFYKDKQKKDGLRSSCKKCQNKTVSDYRKANSVQVKIKDKKYYDKNRIKI